MAPLSKAPYSGPVVAALILSRGYNCVYHRVLIVTVFPSTKSTYVSTLKVTIHFLPFFQHWPFPPLSFATETNSTLLIPIPTSVFSFIISPWLARGTVFAIVIGIYPLLTIEVRRSLNRKNQNSLFLPVIKKQDLRFVFWFPVNTINRALLLSVLLLYGYC